MNLGNGRVLKQESKHQILARSFPVFGEWIHDVIWRPKLLKNDDAPNQFILTCGSAGSGKTNFSELAIDEQIEKGLGGWVMDAAQTLKNHTIRRLAEVGWDPKKVFVVDLFSEHGCPALNLLRHTDISPYEVVEELVSATALMSNLRSTAGPVQLDLTRRSIACLALTNRPLGQITLFMTDRAFREKVVHDTGISEMERFFCGKDSYVSQLN